MHRSLLALVVVAVLATAALAHFGEDRELLERFRGMTAEEFDKKVQAARAMKPAKREGRGRGCQGCLYAFESPIMPSFDLPPAQPNSPGDVTLNVGNPIVHADGSPIPAGGCNGHNAQYLDDQVWTSYYTDTNGQQRKLDNEFYVTGTSLRIRTIQTWQSNLEAVLSGKQVRMDIKCDGVESCIHFFVNAEPKVDTCDECAGLINRTAHDAWLIELQEIHFAAEIIEGNLTKTTNTFIQDEGSVIFYGSGMGGYPTYGPPGSNAVEDFYPSYVMFDQFFNSQEDFNSVIVWREVSDDHIYIETFVSFNHTNEFKGVLPGVAPTYKRVRFPLLVIFQFEVETGRIIQERAFWDQATILKQVGIITDPDLPIVDGDFFDKIFDGPGAGPEFNTFCCLSDK